MQNHALWRKIQIAWVKKLTVDRDALEPGCIDVFYLQITLDVIKYGSPEEEVSQEEHEQN